MSEVVVKVYIDKYDVQGDEISVIPENMDSNGWLRMKQKLINDFVERFDGSNLMVKTKSGKYYSVRDLSKVGAYLDTKKNRLLGRVGQPYTKAGKLLDLLKDIVKNQRKGFSMVNENEVLENLGVHKYSRWSEDELVYVRGLHKSHPDMSARQISVRVFRTPSAIYKKWKSVI